MDNNLNKDCLCNLLNCIIKPGPTGPTERLF